MIINQEIPEVAESVVPRVYRVNWDKKAHPAQVWEEPAARVVQAEVAEPEVPVE